MVQVHYPCGCAVDTETKQFTHCPLAVRLAQEARAVWQLPMTLEQMRLYLEAVKRFEEHYSRQPAPTEEGTP